jgi:SAM-dependent methyltransferase
MSSITPDLVRGIEPSGPTDPIAYYRRPVVGWLYRERINRGLRLLPEGKLGAVLEVGYGSGTVLLALAERCRELHGIDLDAEPATVAPVLAERGVRAELVRGSVCQLPYEAGRFDLCVSFSVFEHLADYRRALAEVSRVLAPGGLFLLGMPAVNRMMELGFRLLGFRGISDHHVTTPAEVAAGFPDAGLEPVTARHLDLPLGRPLGLRLYYDWLLRTRAKPLSP